MKQSEFNLTAISPIDGRYQNQIMDLSDYSSELGLIKFRTKIEIEYLIALSNAGITRKLNSKEVNLLRKIFDDFNIEDAVEIKKI